MPTKSSITAGLLVIGAMLLVAWLLFGCSAVPSTAGVELQSSIDSASTANQTAQRYNDSARTKAQRIDDKTIVIQKYWGQ